MKSNVLKRIEALENGLNVSRKISLLYYTYPVFFDEKRDTPEAEEERAQATLQKKLEEVSQERGEKITEEDVEVIVGIRQFFDKDEERSAIV